MGIDLLDSILNYGTVLQMLDMTNYFVFFHHLMETQRERFDWILFSRINIVTHLKYWSKMLVFDTSDHTLFSFTIF